jgi:hypothetical protein
MIELQDGAGSASWPQRCYVVLEEEAELELKVSCGRSMRQATLWRCLLDCACPVADGSYWPNQIDPQVRSGPMFGVPVLFVGI